jgi:hypothetical protein
MRVLAVFGIALVAVGFVLVVIKVARDKGFVWMIRQHLLAFFIALFLLDVTPVDYFVTRYNVNQILKGNPAPWVQIAVHPINADGLLQLLPLIDSEDERISEGVKALLARRQIELEYEERYIHEGKYEWTYHQVGRARCLKRLQEQSHRWKEYLTDHKLRDQSFNTFQAHGRRWYD